MTHYEKLSFCSGGNLQGKFFKTCNRRMEPSELRLAFGNADQVADKLLL